MSESLCNQVESTYIFGWWHYYHLPFWVCAIEAFLGMCDFLIDKECLAIVIPRF